jgi:excinuclease UvrABC nuclease subunit
MSQFPKEIREFLNDKNLVKQIMDEAHRFAIGYHRKLRRKNALI